MVEKIYNIKNQLLERAERDFHDRTADRIDVKEMGEIIDMIKDLAEAEKSCWEASYYRKVTEAMEGQSGYGGGTGSSAGYGYSSRSGYGMQQQRSGYGSMGHMDPAELKMMLQSMPAAERERILAEVK